MARNPSLRALGVQAEAAGLTLRSTRFGRRPDFAVGPQVEYTKNEQIYGLGVTIALPFWDKKQGEIQTATAEQQKRWRRSKRHAWKSRARSTKQQKTWRSHARSWRSTRPRFSTD